MKKPDNYELKRWLARGVKGIVVHYELVTEDRAETSIELIPCHGKPRTFRGDRALDNLEELAIFGVDFNSVVKLKREFLKELDAYEGFVENNKKDFAEFNRLKKKFGEGDV